MDAFQAIAERQKELDRKTAENGLLQRRIEEAEQEMVTIGKQLDIGQEALQLLEDVANGRRANMKGSIEKVITEALQVIYGPRYSVRLEYDVKNNRSFLDIKVVKQLSNGAEVVRNPSGCGQGVSDTVSVPLRLLVILGSKTDKVCVLDESYKQVNPERVELVSQFIKQVSEELGLQIVMMSHHETMRESVDRAFWLADDGEKTVLRKR